MDNKDDISFFTSVAGLKGGPVWWINIRWGRTLRTGLSFLSGLKKDLEWMTYRGVKDGREHR